MSPNRPSPTLLTDEISLFSGGYPHSRNPILVFSTEGAVPHAV